MWRQGCRCRKLYVAATLSCSGGSGGNSFCNAKSCLFPVNCHRIGVMFSSRAHTAVFLCHASHRCFLCHASHLHALNLVSDVEHEVVVAHHLYVVEQAHDETADAEVACHVGGEEPVARVVVDGRDAGRRGGICYPKISFNSLLLNLPIQFSPVDTVISASARLLLIMSLMRSSKVFLVIKRCTITFFFCPIR